MQKVYNRINFYPFISKLNISGSFHYPIYGFLLQRSLSVLFTITNKLYLALVFTFYFYPLYSDCLYSLTVYNSFNLFMAFLHFALHYFVSIFP